MKIRHGIKDENKAWNKVHVYGHMIRYGTIWMNGNGKGELGLCSDMTGYGNNIIIR